LRRLEFSPEAQADLIDTAAYIARDNPDRARSFVDELEARCAALADFPEAAARGRSLRRICARYRTAATSFSTRPPRPWSGSSASSTARGT